MEERRAKRNERKRGRVIRPVDSSSHSTTALFLPRFSLRYEVLCVSGTVLVQEEMYESVTTPKCHGGHRPPCTVRSPREEFISSRSSR